MHMLEILRRIFLVGLGIGVIALIAWLVFPSSQKAAESITETNPVKKRSLGEIFVRDFLGIPKCGILGGGCSEKFPSQNTSSTTVSENARYTNSDIQTTTLRSGQSVFNSMTVEGEAKSSWFFDSIASGEVKNEKEETVGAFTIRATRSTQGANFVPWTAELKYNDPKTKTGYIVFKNANTSGLAKNAKSLWVPVVFGGQSSGFNNLQPPVQTECRRTGCSGEICSDKDLNTTCMYRPEYACYQNAACERQTNGSCGFTQSVALTRCVRDAGTSTETGTAPTF